MDLGDHSKRHLRNTQKSSTEVRIIVIANPKKSSHVYKDIFYTCLSVLPFAGVSFMKKNKKHIKSSRNRVKSFILKQFIFSYQTSVYVFQFELRWEKLSIGYDYGTRVAIIIV